MSFILSTVTNSQKDPISTIPEKSLQPINEENSFICEWSFKVFPWAYNVIEKIKLMDKRKKFLFIEKYKSSDIPCFGFFLAELFDNQKRCCSSVRRVAFLWIGVVRE